MKLAFLMFGIIGSLGCGEFQASRDPIANTESAEQKFDSKQQKNPVVTGVPVKDRPNLNPENNQATPAASDTKNMKPLVAISDTQVEIATYGVDPASALSAGSDLSQSLARRASREQSESEKTRLEYEEKLRERAEHRKQINEKYQNLAPGLEKLNQDRVNVKKAELAFHKPDLWPLTGLKIHVFEKDTFEKFEIPDSEEFRTGKKNSSLVKLDVDDKENPYVMFDNRVATDSEAMQRMGFRGYGLACKYRMKGNVREGDVLTFQTHTFGEKYDQEIFKTAAWENGKMVNVAFKFVVVPSQVEKWLEIICDIKPGLLDLNLVGFKFSDFVYNFRHVLGFQVEGHPIPTPPKFSDKPLEATHFISSFEILDLDRLKTSDSSNLLDGDSGLVFLDGMIVPFDFADEMIVKGFYNYACGIYERNGNLEVGQKFVLDRIDSWNQDRLKNINQFELNYKSVDGLTKIRFSCISNLTVFKEEIEFVFKNTLKFGVILKNE